MNAREIADSRLAKGEITAEQHAAIILRLANTPDTSPAAARNPENIIPAPTSPTVSSISGWDAIKGFAGFGFLIYLFIYLPISSKKDDAKLLAEKCAKDNLRQCACWVASFEREASIFWYVPILKAMIRPSDQQTEALFTGWYRQCSR